MSLEEINTLIKSQYDSKKLNSEFIASLLDKYDHTKVLFILKNSYNIEFIYETPEKTVIARDDVEYRKLVFQKFTKCIICDNCPSFTHQIAHIWNYKDCKKFPMDAYNINNGFKMCANTHLLFDKHFIQINAISVNSDVSDITDKEYKCIINVNKESSCEYAKYDKKEIILNSKQFYYLQKRYSIL